jgi:hypothetical protein
VITWVVEDELKLSKYIQACIRAFWLSFITNCCSSCLSRSLSLLRSTPARELLTESMMRWFVGSSMVVLGNSSTGSLSGG